MRIIRIAHAGFDLGNIATEIAEEMYHGVVWRCKPYWEAGTVKLGTIPTESQLGSTLLFSKKYELADRLKGKYPQPPPPNPSMAGAWFRRPCSPSKIDTPTPTKGYNPTDNHYDVRIGLDVMAVIAGDGDPSGIYSVGDIVVYVPAGEYAGQLCKDHMERVVEHELQHYVQHLSGEPWGAQSTGDDKKEYRSNTNEIQAFAMTAARNMRLNFMHIVSKLEKDNPGGPSMSSMCLAAWHRDNYPEKWALRYARTYGITNIKDFVLATVRNFNKMMASENKSDQTIPMENNIGKAASTDFPIHVAAETSKEDLSAERQYQSAMAKISERDVKVAVFRAINTVEQQFAESSGSKLRTIASSNTKNVSIETSLTEDRITLGLTVSFFHVPDDSKQILIELIKMAKPIISEEVRNVTGITPSSIKFTMIDTARAGGITRKDPPTTITPPDLSDYKQGDLLPDGHSPLGRRNSFLYLRLPEVPSKPISKGVFRTLSSCPGNGYFIAANYGEIIDRSTTPNNTNAVQIDSPKNPLPKNHCYVVDYASHKVISRLDRVNQK